MITGLRKMSDHWVKEEDEITGLRKMSDRWVKEDD